NPAGSTGSPDSLETAISSRGSSCSTSAARCGRNGRPLRRPYSVDLACICHIRQRFARREPGGEAAWPGAIESGEGCLQLVDEVRPLPREPAIAFGVAPEMAVGGSAGIDRPVELEPLANAARRQINELLQHAGQPLFVDQPGSVGVDI